VGLTGNQWSAIRKATGLNDALDQLGARLGLDLRAEGNRFRAREAITDILAPWFAAHAFKEVCAQLDAHGVCWGKYQTVGELVSSDPECSPANPLFNEIEQPGIGRYLAPGNPLNFAQFARAPVAPAPRLGEHTDQILADDLGLSGAEIGRLHDAGIVAGPAA